MRDHKRTAAFLASLMICISTAAAPISVYAENGDDTSAATVEEFEEDEEAAASTASESYIVSGDFSYSLNSDGSAQIQDCTATGTELTIPDTIDGIKVAELGKTAFGSDPENCPFEKINLPASIEYISSSDPFMYCTKLKEINVDAANEYYTVSDGVLFSKDMTLLVCYPQMLGGSSYTIPEGVTELGSAALYNTGLEEITFPSTLAVIDYFALGSLTGLTSVDMSGTALSSIGSFAFSGCSALSEVKLPDTLYGIDGGAFYNCKALTEITLPENLNYIGQYAFMDTGLKSIEIPESVESIAYSALGYCTAANGEETPVAGFTVIGQYGSAAYTYCTDSDSDYGYTNDFTFMTPEQAQQQSELLAQERFTEGAFEYAVISDKAVITLCTSQDTVIDVPDTLGGYPVSTIYPAAFSGLTATVINLPDSVTTIREMAFYNCAYLQSITLPAGTESVGNNAFDTCTSLETIDFGGAKTIGQSVFYGCTSLKSVTISGECTEISVNGDGDTPFMDASALEEIIVTEGNGNYCTENGVLYNKDKTTLYAYPSAKKDKEFTLPSTVKEIAQSAFYHAVNLEKVDISGVETIGTYAFEECSALKSVKTTNTITSLGVDAFFNCTSLKSLRFGDKLTTIGSYAYGFYYNEDADTENDEQAETLVEGFKLYCDKDSTAYKFAKNYGIETVTGTVELFGKNVDKTFLWVMAGILLAAIAAVIGIITGRSIKKKKAEKKEAERQKELAERRAKKREEAEKETGAENGKEETNEE